MAKILINKKQYVVNELENLLSVCLSAGINLPYFCWHPDLGSVGVCRQCAVKQYSDITDTNGRIIMSCMTPVLDGLIISTNDSESRLFRKSIIELLMTNHPHDCPVCEEGGSCHLQDMTVMTQHTTRHYRFSKRTHKSQYLGPFINHEMNRCIACYKCVRFYKDYADGTDLGVYGISNNVYFGRLDDGDLQSEFSGNLVEVCPTGVFTDKTYSNNYVRKWDMQYAPSVCQHCCIGCNISVGERSGIVRKIENRYHENINRYFLCDLGRFSYGYSNLNNRPTKLIHRTMKHEQYLFDKDIMIKLIAQSLTNASALVGIGSCRSSLENNFALQKLVGKENFSIGVLAKEYDCINLITNILKSESIHIPSLLEIERYDTILILGEDITQTSPRLALSIRQAIKKKSSKTILFNNIPLWHASAIKNAACNFKNKLFLTNIDTTKLDDISDECFFSSVQDQVCFGLEIINQLNNSSYYDNNFSVNSLKKIKAIVLALLNSKNPLIISGVHSNNTDLIKVAFNIAKLLKNLKKNVGLVLLTSHVNSVGIGLLGGLSIDNIINKILCKQANVLIVLENDLYRYLPQSIIKKVFKLSQIIVIDHLNTSSVDQGNFILPACNSFESSGTVINYEGRAQSFFKVYTPHFYKKNVYSLVSWKWLHYIDCELNQKKIKWFTARDVINSVSATHPVFKELNKLNMDVEFESKNKKVARAPYRFSGRTALYSDIDIHEPKQPNDCDTPFVFSMEGLQQPQNSSNYIPYVWSPGWNSVQAINVYQRKKALNHFSTYNSGLLLFTYTLKFTLPFFTDFLSRSSFRKQNYYIFPYYFLFVNEELAQNSLIIKKNIVLNFIIINELDANEMFLTSGSKVECTFLDIKLILEVRLSFKLHRGQIGLPLGAPNIPLYLIGEEIVSFRKLI